MNFFTKSFKIILLTVIVSCTLPIVTKAATLLIYPNTGVYVAGKTFTVRVAVNTEGRPINATEGTLKFNPQEATVVSIDKTGSIFNLWVTEPTFSNSAGTINFSGGVPSGYTGGSGTIFNVTFRTVSAGTARLAFTNGSVLANDGMGTNVLSGMNGGTFTIQAPTSQPAPEVIEYVAPANTPLAPSIKSSTHEVDAWSNNNKAILKWDLPSGITAVRTALDSSPSTVPTKVYENPIREITLDSLPEGISYFHLQFKNNEGWGKISRYKLMVDTVKPASFDIISANEDSTNPIQVLKLDVKDDTSGVIKYKVRIDSDEVFDYTDEEETGMLELPSLSPGYHSVIIEAFDRAGNGLIGSYSFTIEAFDRPRFTEYPSEINEEVIPVIRGLTRPNSEVEVMVRKIGSEPVTYKTTANDDGVFTFIPESRFSTGVYEFSARAKDQFGALSDLSDVIRIAVQEPGHVRFGSYLINLFSVAVPLIGTLLLLVMLSWYLWVYLRRFKRRVTLESKEAEDILNREFTKIKDTISLHESNLINSKKTKKLTKAETELIVELRKILENSQTNIQKEIADVEKIVEHKQ